MCVGVALRRLGSLSWLLKPTSANRVLLKISSGGRGLASLGAASIEKIGPSLRSDHAAGTRIHKADLPYPRHYTNIFLINSLPYLLFVHIVSEPCNRVELLGSLGLGRAQLALQPSVLLERDRLCVGRSADIFFFLGDG